MIIFLLFITTCLLCFISYIARGKELFSCSLLMSATFALSSFLYLISLGFYEQDISMKALFCVICCLLLVFAGEQLACRISVKQNSSLIFSQFDIKTNYSYLCNYVFLFITIGIMAFATYEKINLLMMKAMSLGGYTSLSGMMTILRSYEVSHISVGGTNVFISQSYEFSFCAFVVYSFVFLYERIIYEKKNNLIKLIPLLIYFIQLFFGTSRSEYIKAFTIIITIIAALLKIKHQGTTKANTRAIKYGIISIIAFILIFKFIGSFTYSQVTQVSFFHRITKYSSSSLLGLTCYLNDGMRQETLFAQNTFRNIYIFLDHFGFDISKLHIHWDFFNWSHGTSNIYTGIAPIIADFGVVCPLVFVLIGYLFTRIKLKSLNSDRINLFYIFFLGLFTYCVVMMSIADEFNVLLTTSLIYDYFYMMLILKLGFKISNDDNSFDD